MHRAITTVFAAFFAVSTSAADGTLASGEEMPEYGPFDAFEVNLSDFLWEKRPVVVFAQTEADPAFQRQMELLLSRPDALLERDIVILVDTSPQELSEVREKLRPRGFMLALIGKDGQVKLRKPRPWDVRELTRVIDKMPLRRQELRDQRAAQSGSDG